MQLTPALVIQAFCGKTVPLLLSIHPFWSPVICHSVFSIPCCFLSQTISSLWSNSIWSVKSSWTFTICSICPCSVQSKWQNGTLMKALDLSLQYLQETHSKGQTAYSRNIHRGLNSKSVVLLQDRHSLPSIFILYVNSGGPFPSPAPQHSYRYVLDIIQGNTK